MCEIANLSKGSLTAAVILLGIASFSTAKAANILVNGWFTQPSQPNISQMCITGPASGPSAAAGWSQWAFVPDSHTCTYLESTFLPRIRVKTNGGDWPHAAMGNGFGQYFGPKPCVKATYWYNVVSGQNLVSAVTHAFIDF